MGLTYPHVHSFSNLADKKTLFFSKFGFYIRVLILSLIIVALARPQIVTQTHQTQQQGIDVLLLLDISVSMNAEDLLPNRLEMAKVTISRFIKKRKSDRIGLVVFGGYTITKSPLTTDYILLDQFLSQTQTGTAGQGTAIGLALSSGLNRLKNSSVKSRVIILLTDGENNTGNIDPVTAAKLAKELGVKIYTIGVGKEGGARIPIYDSTFGKRYLRVPGGAYQLTKLNEEELKEIAQISQGKYFRAVDNQKLNEIYDTIDALEKSKINKKQFQHTVELFPFILWIIFTLLLLKIVILNLLIIKVP